MAEEMVDILVPPLFHKSGVVKPRTKAWEDCDWIATFNLWIFKPSPKPSIIFQIRSMRSSFEPGKLDISAAGHYSAGEEMYDGLREAEEELGKKYHQKDVLFLGKRAYVGPDTKKRLRQNVVHVFAVIDDSPLESYRLDPIEVSGICNIPIEKFLHLYRKPGTVFTVTGLDPQGNALPLTVTMDSFIRDWNAYKYNMALNGRRILRGEADIFI